MPRIRSIKPDFFKSEDVSALPLRARLTWVGLWTHCDDHGRYKDSVRLIKGDLWSLDDVSLRDIEEDLAALEAERRIVRYEVDGKRYLAVVNWHAHQAINRPSRPKYPAPPRPLGSSDPDDLNHCDECAKPGQGVLTEPSVSPPPVENPSGEVPAGQHTHGALSEPSVSPHGGLTPGKEGKGKEGKGGDVRADERASEPPTPDDPTAEPPPLRCPNHIKTLDPPPCRACRTAREHRERWDAERLAAGKAAAKAAQSSAAAERAETARIAITACDTCDAEGRLPGGRLCHHDPGNDERTAQGLAAVRSQIRKRPS